MNFIKKLIGHKQDTLIEQAEKTVSSANFFAVSSFVTTLDRFPILSKVDPKQWDFIVSVAGIFISASRLTALRLDSKREEIAMDILTKKLNEWDPDGIKAFEDCKHFFEMEYDRLAISLKYQKEKRFLAADALGIWIVWNLFKRQAQSDEEVNLARVIGMSVTSAFFDWWR